MNPFVNTLAVRDRRAAFDKGVTFSADQHFSVPTPLSSMRRGLFTSLCIPQQVYEEGDNVLSNFSCTTLSLYCLTLYNFISSVTVTLILWPCTIIIYLTPGMSYEHNKYGNDRYRKGAVTQRPCTDQYSSGNLRVCRVEIYTFSDEALTNCCFLSVWGAVYHDSSEYLDTFFETFGRHNAIFCCALYSSVTVAIRKRTPSKLI